MTCFSHLFQGTKQGGVRPPWETGVRHSDPVRPHGRMKDDKGQLENRRTATTLATSQEERRQRRSARTPRVHREFQRLIPSSLRLSSNYQCGRHSDLEHGGANESHLRCRSWRSAADGFHVHTAVLRLRPADANTLQHVICAGPTEERHLQAEEVKQPTSRPARQVRLGQTGSVVYRCKRTASARVIHRRRRRPTR